MENDNWTIEGVRDALAGRSEREKRAGELRVDYYRIGLPMAFALPVGRRPGDFPLAWEGFEGYPWQTWLAWRLEERWRALHAGWRMGDAEAGGVFQRELAALIGWEALAEPVHGVNLVTGHMAGCLALGLSERRGWDGSLWEQASSAARALLERDVRPWVAKQWPADEAWGAGRIHNIAMITLVRSAQLAWVMGHEDAGGLNGLAERALRTLLDLRRKEHYTEGFAYDGYLMDHVTEWLKSRPDGVGWMAGDADGEAWESLREQWVYCVLPGRADIQAPVGDVEPEMMFWTSALMRLASVRDWRDALWLLRRAPVERLPTAALVEAACGEFGDPWRAIAPSIKEGPRDIGVAVSLRSGWEVEDCLVTVGCPRITSGHLHRDGGHVMIGRWGRWWVVDPGYQQYRPGLEREYTIGPAAHNGPIIGGKSQTRQAAKVMVMEMDHAGRQHVCMDLSACYEGLAGGASVRREVWLELNGDVRVEDAFEGLGAGVLVEYHWHGAWELAWGFADGQARLSDGERALLIESSTGELHGGQVHRHPGSCGAWTLTDRREAGGGDLRWVWVFRWEQVPWRQ